MLRLPAHRLGARWEFAAGSYPRAVAKDRSAKRQVVRAGAADPTVEPDVQARHGSDVAAGVGARAGSGAEASVLQRRAVAGLVTLETVLILVGAGFLVVGAITTPNASALPATIFLVLVGLTIAVVLGFAALAVLGGERWSRGPIFTWQLLQGGVAMPLTVGGSWWLGLPMLAVAIVVGVLVAGRRVILRRPGD